MIKLNRIAYKLGFAGLCGIGLSLVMFANQMVSEASINVANERAENQQSIANRAFEGDIALRRMQLAARDIRLAKNPAGVEKGLANLK